MLVSQILKSKGAAVFTASPNETIEAAAALLHSRRVGAMVVTDGGRVVHPAFAGAAGGSSSDAAPPVGKDPAEASKGTEPGLDARPPAAVACDAQRP